MLIIELYINYGHKMSSPNTISMHGEDRLHIMGGCDGKLEFNELLTQPALVHATIKADMSTNLITYQ